MNKNVKETQEGLSGASWVVAGLVIIAVTTLALQVVRIFKVWNVAEFAAIFVFFLSWLLILWGATLLLRQGKSWRKMWILAIIVSMLVVLQGLVAFRNVRNGMLEQSFIDIVVMFLFYLMLLGLFYGYRRMLRGMAFAVKGEDASLARKCMTAWLPCCCTTMVTLILIPITGMFSPLVEYIGTGILGTLGLFAQLYMCMLITRGHALVSDRQR